MICISFKVVVYFDGLVSEISSWTDRTVAGPVLQRMLRISFSASVGRECVFRGLIFEIFSTNIFVCQQICREPRDRGCASCPCRFQNSFLRQRRCRKPASP